MLYCESNRAHKEKAMSGVEQIEKTLGIIEECKFDIFGINLNRSFVDQSVGKRQFHLFRVSNHSDRSNECPKFV